MEYATGAKVDHYEILSQLGHSNFSNVYQARDTKTGKTVVLKFPHVDVMGDSASHERYLREANMGTRLEHPGIQHILNSGETRTETYIVMEYVDGKTLRSLMHEGQTFSPEQAIDLTIQVLEALDYCHTHNVFHRDMKPENLMVTPAGKIKIMDFGIALVKGARRVTWRGLSSTIGTPDYMAPEQIQGERGDARTDVYGLGTVLYELLCGRVPFEGDNVLSIASQHINSEPPPLHKFNRKIRPELEAVVMKAIRRDPRQRYQNAQEFIYDLTHLDEIDPAQLLPPATKLRHPLPSWVYITAIISSIIGGIIALGILGQLLHGR